MENSENQTPETEQEQGKQEQPDAITLLATELKEIRQALGIGSDASSSSLLNRLDSIERSLSKNQRERNLPASISRADAANPSAMRKLGVTIEDIASGKVEVD